MMVILIQAQVYMVCILNSRIPKWPLISTNNNSIHLLNMDIPHDKYKTPYCCPSLDIVFTTFAKFDVSPDLKWPLNSTKVKRDHSLNMVDHLIKYGINQGYPS